MKNKIGIFFGFVLGAIIGFALIVIISKMHPEEDLAGLVIFICLLGGLLFAFLGYFVQNYLRENNKIKI